MAEMNHMTTLDQFESNSIDALEIVVKIHNAVRKALTLCDEIAALRGGNEGDKLAINTLWEVAKQAASEIGEQARGAANNAALIEMTTVEPFTKRTATNKFRLDNIESCASVTELRMGEIEAALRLAKRVVGGYERVEPKNIDGYRATYITPDFWTSYTPEERLRRLREALEEGAVITHTKHWPLRVGPAMATDFPTHSMRKLFDDGRMAGSFGKDGG